MYGCGCSPSCPQNIRLLRIVLAIFKETYILDSFKDSYTYDWTRLGMVSMQELVNILDCWRLKKRLVATPIPLAGEIGTKI